MTTYNFGCKSTVRVIAYTIRGIVFSLEEYQSTPIENRCYAKNPFYARRNPNKLYPGSASRLPERINGDTQEVECKR